MEKLQIAVLGLAGVKISDGKTVIYVDAFFSEHTITPFDYSDATIIMVTHDHADHFGVEAVTQAAIKTGAIVVGPPSIAYPLLVKCGLPSEQLRILYHQDPNTADETRIGEVVIRSYASRHFFDGDNMTIHNSYFMEIGGKKVFLTGDSTAIPEKEARLKGLDVLIYNFVIFDKDLTRVAELETVMQKFVPRLLLPVHLVDCDWTISPEVVEHEVNQRHLESVKVLKTSGSWIEV